MGKYKNVERFILYYKIAKLQDLKIISDEVAELLEILFSAKEKITREIAKGLYFIETSNIGENVDDEELFF